MSYIGNSTSTQTATPTDGSVTTPKIVDGAVTPAKLSTGAPTWNSAGNVGIGTSTPSAWGSSFAAMQLGASASIASHKTVASQLLLNTNSYYDGATYRYINSSSASDYYQVFGTHVWRTAPSGTAGNPITFTQALTLNANGALALQGGNSSANGVGIAFPVTQAASSDANTLDDYEEGTWTPSSSANVTVNSVFSGTYIKVGRLIHAYCYINVSVPIAGTIQLNGLPFNCRGYGAVASYYGPASAGYSQYIENGATWALISGIPSGTNSYMFNFTYHQN